MSRIRRLFRLALRPSASRREIDDEFELHVELRAAELRAAGMSERKARIEAERLFGDREALGRVCYGIDRRAARRLRWRDLMSEGFRDLVFASRTLRRRPLLAGVAIIILAIGIGANTAVFSLVDAVILRPLPFADSERLVMLQGSDDEGTFRVSEQERLRYRAEGDMFAGVATFAFGSLTLQGDGDPERLQAAFVDADLFSVAGLRLTAGRPFTRAENVPGANDVALISHALATRRFGDAGAALGTRLRLSGQPVTVVGVVAPEVRLPGDFGGGGSDVYAPLALDEGSPDVRNIHYLEAMARVRPDVTPERLRARLDLVGEELRQEIPLLPATFRIAAPPVVDEVLGPFRAGAGLLFAAVGLLLLLACGNIAGLLLASAESRHHEFAVRAALGAGGGRLARQVLAESVVLSLVGGTAGIGLGILALRGLVAASPPQLPRIGEVGVDARVLLFGFAAIAVTAVVCGLMPAVQARRRDLAVALRSETRTLTAGRRRHTTRRALVIAEVALAITIAAGAGLVLRSWANVISTDPGFPVTGKVSFQLSLPSTSYPTRASRWQYYATAVSALNDQPGVLAAGAVSALPLAQGAGDWGFLIEGRPPIPRGMRKPFADRILATPGYFEAMQIPLVEGRFLEASDDDTHRPVVLLNESVARRYWPAGNAIGARIRLSTDIDPVWREVVGVVGDVRSRGLEQDTRPEFFFPHGQFPASSTSTAAGTMSVVVRSSGDPDGLVRTIRGTLRGIDPSIPISQLQSMEGVLASTLSVRRFQLLLLGFFAVCGLGLVAVGVYGVVAFLVEQRTAEFGVRMALGSDRGGIIRLVLKDAARLGGLGIVLGLLGALAAGRLLEGALFQVDPVDLPVFAGVAGLALTVVLGASLTPALRAAHTDVGGTLNGS